MLAGGLTGQLRCSGVQFSDAVLGLVKLQPGGIGTKAVGQNNVGAGL